MESSENGYAVDLDELEDGVRVPPSEQTTLQSAPPAEAPLAAEELDRNRLLGIEAAGRLRHG